MYTYPTNDVVFVMYVMIYTNIYIPCPRAARWRLHTYIPTRPRDVLCIYLCNELCRVPIPYLLVIEGLWYVQYVTLLDVVRGKGTSHIWQVQPSLLHDTQPHLQNKEYRAPLLSTYIPVTHLAYLRQVCAPSAGARGEAAGSSVRTPTHVRMYMREVHTTQVQQVLQYLV